MFGILQRSFALAVFLGPIHTLQAQQFTLELEVGGKRVVGGPLAWSDREVLLLARDGSLMNISPQQVASYRKTDDRFAGLSANDLRGQLQMEFSRGFTVAVRGVYVVVHPEGSKDNWSPVFEQLHRAFVHYFAARGWRPDPPGFPLVAVVFPTKESFRKYAARERAALIEGTIGYYSLGTNRVALYERSSGGSQVAGSDVLTVVHEATHQLAFNTGIHSRYAPPPLWVAEGLSTLFESPEVWDSTQSSARHDRADLGRLEAFQRTIGSQSASLDLAGFLASDQLFESQPESAYAMSWALTWYLTENLPRDYFRYMRQIASRRNFTEYSAQQRVRDFTEIFGGNLSLVEARLRRAMTELSRRHQRR